MDRAGLGLGALPAVIGISYCVGLAVLALPGLSSVWFASTLGTPLYDTYGV